MSEAIQSGNYSERDEWWCLRSQGTGHLWTDDPAVAVDGALEFRGAVLAFHDRGDAEAWAAGQRQLYPLMTIDVEPLPSAPPQVCRGPQTASLIVAMQIDIAHDVTGERAMIEVRPHPHSEAQFSVSIADMLASLLNKLHTVKIGVPRVIRIGLSYGQPAAIGAGESVHDAIDKVMGQEDGQ